MAQLLVGYDTNGNIRNFDEDGNIAAGGAKLKDCIFINFSRLLTKDEIKKGSFSMKLGTGSYSSPHSNLITISDSGKQNDYRVNSPAGEYSFLYITNSSGGPVKMGGDDGAGGVGPTSTKVGLIYYQAVFELDQIHLLSD